MPAVAGYSLIHPGAPLPTKVAGNYYFPDGATIDSVTTLTTTVNRLAYWLHWQGNTQTYVGAACWNTGAGDNGETLRLGIYTHGTAGPTTLLKDFGEITLSGAAAERLLTSSVTITGGQWVWWCAHHNTAATMLPMSARGLITAVGYLSAAGEGANRAQEMGIVAPPNPPALQNVSCVYVDTAYGALASTAVAPTATTLSMTAIALKV